MKRILSVLLAVVMVLALAAPAMAESKTVNDLRDVPQFTLTADKTQVQRGENVTLTVNLSGSYVATSMVIKLFYDPEKFEFVSVAKGDVLNAIAAAGGTALAEHGAANHVVSASGMIFMPGQSFNSTGSVYSVTLQAKTDAALGTVDFEPQVTEFKYLSSGTVADDVEFASSGTTVEIIEAVIPEGVVISAVPSKTTVQPGETFNVEITITGDYEAMELSFRFPFNNTLFTAGTAVAGPVADAVEADDGTLTITPRSTRIDVALEAGETPFSANGVICTIPFTVKDGVEGSYTFSFNNVAFTDAAEEDIEYETETGTVTIAAEARPVVFTATPSKTEVLPGETFTVDFSVTGTYEAHAITWQLSNDFDRFEVVSLTDGEVITAARLAGGTAMTAAENLRCVIIMPTDPLTAEGVIFTVTLRVKDSATGSYTFNPIIDRFSNMPAGQAETPIEYSTENATVTIGAAEPVVFTATASKAQVEQGETFTVEFKISGTYAAHSITWQLGNDFDRFEVLDLTEGEVIQAARAAGGTVMAAAENLRCVIIMPTDPLTAEGVIFTATLKVKDDATGTYTFNPEITQFLNYPANGAPTPIEHTTVGAPVEIVEVAPTEYTITWKVDGQDDVTTTVTEGETPVYPNGTPTKEADAQYTYEFAGWDPEVVPATADATYTATWTQIVNEYTITWNIDGATETETYAYGATPTHADPTKEGYTFTGWTPEIAPVTGDATYTAQFTVNKYRLSIYYLNQATNGAIANAVFADIEYGAEYSYTSPEITGYHLVDEAQAVISGTMPAQAVEIDVYYVINTYTITWVVDGQENVTTTVNHGETPVYPNGTPAKEADAQYTYEFAGWTPNVVAATEDATYIATWNTTVNTYTITWNIDGETETETYAYGQTPAHNDPTKPADAQYTYTFAGWDPEIVPVTGDATYTATWNTTLNTYTLTVNYYRYSTALEDWVAVQSPSVTTLPYGSEYTANIPNEIDGYVLDHVDGEATGTITGNVIVDAYYVIPEFIITWVVEGQEDVTTTASAGQIPVYPYGTPVKTGDAQYSYTFAGWDPEVVPANGNATYTATWTQTVNTYTITWNIDGETETETYEYGATPTHADPTKEPGDHVTYTFAGWDPEIVPVTGDATYTATWTETKFGSVTYLVNGIQIAKLENVTEMTEDMVPEGIAWYGFVFKSWDKTIEEINAELAQGNDVVVNGVMEVMVTNIHVTTIYGDEVIEKDYTESRWLTVTAKPTNSAGEYFQYWTIDNVIISYSPKATVRIVASCTLEAHYGAEQIEATGVAQLLKADYDNLNKREIFVAYMAAPDGATITGAGLYAASGAVYDPATGELNASNAQYTKNVNISDATKPCSYTWYKSNVNEGDVWYIRVFVNYELDGETYSVLGETVAITAGENYVAGN